MQGPPDEPDPGVPKMDAEFAGALPCMMGAAMKSLHLPWQGMGGVTDPPNPPRPVPLPEPPVGVEPGLTPAHPSDSPHAPRKMLAANHRARFIDLSLPDLVVS
jgi:hypothetical protein